MLVPEKEADGIFLGHIPGRTFSPVPSGRRPRVPRWPFGGLRKASALPVIFRSMTCASPAAAAPTRRKRFNEKAVLPQDQVERRQRNAHPQRASSRISPP